MSSIALVMPLEKVTKSEQDGDHPSSHYLYVPDPSKPSTWKLPFKTPSGAIDKGRLGPAWAALHKGFRGNRASLPDSARAAAISRLKRAYKAAGLEPPDERETSDLKKSMMADKYVLEFLTKTSSQGTEQMDMSLAAQRAEMDADHEKDVRMKRADFEKKMSGRRADHQKKLDDMDADHQKNVTALTKDLPEYQPYAYMPAEVKAAHVQHAYNKAKLTADHEHENRLLEADHNHDLDTMRADHLRKVGPLQMSMNGYC